MVTGIAEAYAGIIDDPLYGPAIVFGLGGIFVEILKDTAIEMAPLSNDDALAMIHRLKAAPVLLGARGRPRGDIAALAALLVRLSHFAVANAGTISRARSQSDHRQGRGRRRRRRRHRSRYRRHLRNGGTPMKYKDLIYGVKERIATITLNRPDRMNALSPNLEAEMHRAFDQADADRAVKVIVLTGSGNAFCAGIDMSNPSGNRSRRPRRATPIRPARQSRNTSSSGIATTAPASPSGSTCGGSASRSSPPSTAGRWAAASGTSSPPTSRSRRTRRCSRNPRSATSRTRASCSPRCAAGRPPTAGR